MNAECAKEAYKFLPVKVWSGQRVAASPAPNPTCREATNCMKLGGGRYQAPTKVKVMSPEIHGCRRPTAFGDWKAALRESAKARTQQPDGVKGRLHDTTRSLYELGRAGIFSAWRGSMRGQAVKGKESQMVSRQSDHFIVPLRRGNARGGKGVAVAR